MADLLVATAAFTVTVALGCVVLLGVTAAPLFLSLQLAEERGFSVARWGAVSLTASAVGLASAFLLSRLHVPFPLLAVSLAVTWVGPGVLALADRSQIRLGGASGRHE